MQIINELLELLNPWWKTNKVSKELAQEYKRRPFQEIIKLLTLRQIIILTGLRRVGKTTLLYQVIEHLTRKADAKRIVYFNLDKKVDELTEILKSYQELTDINWREEKVYFFIDEISKLKEWGSKIKLLYDAFPNIKFFVSSSSSVGLEEEAIKNLGGRYFMLNISPLNFKEYLELKGNKEYINNPKLWESEIKNASEKYLLQNFPETINWDDPLLIKDYLMTTIVDKIIRQDLIEKFPDINKNLLLDLLKIFYSEPGFFINYDNLSNDFGVSKKTLYHHIFCLEFSYLIRIIKNFRLSSLSSSRKLQRIYAHWWSLAYCYSENEDKLMENVIASCNNIKHYWREKEKEIDFLIIKDKKIIPLEIKNKKDLDHDDLKNMMYFLEKYKMSEGFVVYKGDERTILKDKKIIQLIPLWKWLLEN